MKNLAGVEGCDEQIRCAVAQMNLYHKRFLGSFSSENVIALFSRYRNAAKEITESWAMLEAFKLVYGNNSEDVKVIVVGDGCSPRTGALIAYFAKADVISIDPAMNMPHWQEHCEKQGGIGFPVQRLKVHKARAEECDLNAFGKDCVIIFPHSHADMMAINVKGCKTLAYIAMPCCVPIPHKLMRNRHEIYDDQHVISPKRTIHIWRDLDIEAVRNG